MHHLEYRRQHIKTILAVNIIKLLHNVIWHDKIAKQFRNAQRQLGHLKVESMMSLGTLDNKETKSANNKYYLVFKGTLRNFLDQFIKSS